MRTVTVVLDGTEYQVEELRSRANREWRGMLEGHFAELVGALEGAPSVDVTDGEALGGLVRSVGGTLLGSVDLVGELLVEYAPALKDQVGEAYDSEILEAFTGVLGLAFPFGPMVERLRGLGSQLGGTLQS